MRTYFTIMCLAIYAVAFGQLSGKHEINTFTSLGAISVSKAQVDAVKGIGPSTQSNGRALQQIIVDYDGTDELLAVDSGAVYERFIWDLNTRYKPNNPNRFALTWGVVAFDSLYDFNSFTAFPRSSTPVIIDSVELFITHQNTQGTPDTIQVSVYQWQGTAGIQVNAQEEIINTKLYDTLIITTTSLTPAANQLGALSIYPGVQLTYPNNRFLVGVHFYGDTLNHTFTILAGYSDRCGGACYAYTSVFELNSFWRMIAWAGSTNLTGINNIAYDCNGDAVVGDPDECEEFPIQNFAIRSYLTINPSLTATISASDNTICPGETISLSVTPIGGTGPYSVSWSPTAGLTSPFAASTNATINSTTTYTATITDGASNTITRTVTITVNGIGVNAGADQNIGCGQTANLTATVSGVVTGATFNWSNGVNTLNNPGVGAGTYTITALNSLGCTASDAVVVTIPGVTQILSFNTNLTNNSGCKGTPVAFTNTSRRTSGWNWAWTFGDGSGNISTTQSATYTYNSAGTYTVTLSADSAGCTVSSYSRTITMVNCGSSTCTPSAPTGTPGFTPEWECLQCVQRGVSYAEVIQIENFSTIGGLTIQSLKIDSITDLPTGLSYTINPSNGTLSGGATGCIDITGTTASPTGNYQLGIYVTVVISGIGPISGEASDLVDQLIQLGIIDTTVTPAPDFGYFIRVIQQGGTCFMPGTCQNCNSPLASYSYLPTGLSVSFSDQSTNTPTSWLWTFGDGNSSMSQNPVHTYTTAGNYSVCLTSTNSCGSNTSCQTVSVTCIAPTVSFSHLVSGLNATFTDNSLNNPTSWLWTFGDGNSSTQRNPSHNYSTTGNYTACLSATNSCGTNTSCQNLIISCSVNAVITPSATNICSGDTATLTASTGSGYTYQWYRNGSVISGANNIVYQAAQQGAYTVVVSNGSCSSTSTAINLNVYTASQVSISSSGSSTFCAGGSLTLQATAGFSSYQWNTGSTASSIIVTTSGDYTVTVTDANGCSSSSGFLLNASSLQPPNICIVGLDSATNNNIIVWEKPVTTAIDSYIVYKEGNQANVYVRLTSQPYNTFSTFIDASSNPQQQAYRYKLGIVDSCGSLTLPGNFHKTIHLTINQGVGNTWNLIWSHYEGIAFSSYNIYRGTSQSQLTLLTSIASNLDSYTDLNPPAGPTLVYYQIEIVLPNSCTPTAKMGNYGVSRSNIVNTGSVGAGSLFLPSVYIYPNPFSNNTRIELPERFNGQYELKLIDLLGNQIGAQYQVQEQSILLERGNLSKGIYFVEVRGARRYFGKIIVAD